MKELICVVVGGGYAGINTVKAIRKTFKEQAGDRVLRIVLIDKNTYHLRKVLLFKAAARDEEIRIPLTSIISDDAEIIQAMVTKIQPEEKMVVYENALGKRNSISYDFLVLAIGSVLQKPSPERGGMALTSLEGARDIKEAWRTNMKKAVEEKNTKERQRLMTIAVVGGGISGIETSAELAFFMRADAAVLGLDPNDVQVKLVNANSRLFPEGPVKVGHKLERLLDKCGVTTFHRSRGLQEKAGVLALSNGRTMSVGLCVWVLGNLSNPMLQNIGLPITQEGYVMVDESYRVQGAEGVYSIGDCAQILDPASGRMDGKTCKEAAAQAERLGKVIVADCKGLPAPAHKKFTDFFCFALGPERAMIWTRQWGLNFTLTGKLARRIREFTWDSASLIK